MYCWYMFDNSYTQIDKKMMSSFCTEVILVDNGCLQTQVVVYKLTCWSYECKPI